MFNVPSKRKDSQLCKKKIKKMYWSLFIDRFFFLRQLHQHSHIQKIEKKVWGKGTPLFFLCHMRVPKMSCLARTSVSRLELLLLERSCQGERGGEESRSQVWKRETSPPPLPSSYPPSFQKSTCVRGANNKAPKTSSFPRTFAQNLNIVLVSSLFLDGK